MLSNTLLILILMIWTQFELTVHCQEDEQAESYVTCDFDLLSDQEPVIQARILGRLPRECQEIAAGNESHQYQQMLVESQMFKEFTKELDNKEIKEDPNYEDIPVKQWKFRNDIYAEAELHECSNNKTANEFIDCLIQRRQYMIEEIINMT